MGYGYYSKNSGGETFIGIAITVVIIAIIGIAALNIVGNYGGANKEEAEKNARDFASELGLDVKHITCVSYDSDHDGYVSCTIAHNDGGKVELMPVECAKAFSFNHGCRAQKIMNNFRRKW